MVSYLLKRLMLMIPTLLGILTINFFIAQIAPGGPVEQMIARALQSDENSADSALPMDHHESAPAAENSKKWRGASGLDPRFVAEIEARLGFDKPLFERFYTTIKNYLSFDFGNSFFRDRPVIQILLEKLPVSLSLGVWSTLLIYLISIPLGMYKAVHAGSRFDALTSGLIIIAYAIPSLLLAILLIVLFSGGSFWSFFPLKGIVSDHFSDLTLWGKIKDYAWHMALPTLALVIVGIANQTLLIKNSFLEEIGKQYATTAAAKGCSSRQVLTHHIFRNAALVMVANFPATVAHMMFAGSLIIEIVFTLDGIGLLGFEAAMARDYPIVLGTLYILSLLGLLLHLLGDIFYMLIDPRIQLEEKARS